MFHSFPSFNFLSIYSILLIFPFYSASYTVNVLVNECSSFSQWMLCSICQQSWWCPFFRITSAFQAQSSFIQCRCWLSGSQLAWVSYHIKHWECNDEAGSIPALKKLTVWKGALTKNTHSHINVRGKKCSNKGDIKAQLRVRGRHRRVLKNTCWWKRLRSEGTAGKGSYVWKSVEASWGMQIA